MVLLGPYKVEGGADWALVRAWAGMRGRKKKSWSPRKEDFLFMDKGIWDYVQRIFKEGIERGILGRVQKNSNEFETYSNRKIEKGFASPLR